MEILKKTKDYLASLADVTEAGSKIAKLKIEVVNLDRKLGLAYKQIGERVYKMDKEGDIKVAADSVIGDALKEISKIQSRMEIIHQEVASAKERALSEWDRAAKTVKDEASRASKAVKKEADRAATLLKDETKKAKNVIKKAASIKKADKAHKPAAKKAVSAKKPSAAAKAAPVKKKTAAAGKSAAGKKSTSRKATKKKSPPRG